MAVPISMGFGMVVCLGLMTNLVPTRADWMVVPRHLVPNLADSMVASK